MVGGGERAFELGRNPRHLHPRAAGDDVGAGTVDVVRLEQRARPAVEAARRGQRRVDARGVGGVDGQGSGATTVIVLGGQALA